MVHRSSQPRVRGYTWNTRPDACPALLEVHDVTWTHRFKPGIRHSLPHWALIGLLTPGFRVRAGNERARWVEHPPFTWRLYPPGCAFWEDDRQAPGPTHSLWIAFSGGERIGLSRFLASSGYATMYDPSGILVAHAQAMVDKAETLKESGYWSLQMELVRMIVLLEGARREKEGFYRLGSTQLDPVRRDPRVIRAQQFIQAHVMDRIELTAIARHAGTSIPTLARCFKEATGESPMQAWTRLRISRARDALLDGKSLKEIAETLGFYDAFHLSKTFKQFQGASPRDWLKKARALPRSSTLHLNP